jgi:hypothetical protein
VSRHGKSACLLLLCLCAALLSCSSRDPRVESFARLPDWRGIWIAEDFDNTGISGYPDEGQPGWKMQLGGAKAPWTPAAAEKLKTVMPQLLAADATRKASGWGYPGMMDGAPPMQFLITPEETLILNFYREVRHVYTDGRGHPAEQDRWPTPWGDSVGHWEGDTLVIDTVSVKRPGLLPVPPLLSEQAHYVERLRKTAPDRIEAQMTIEDPGVLATPWVITVVYRRTKTVDRLIHDTFDNDRTQIDSSGMTIAPPQH